MSLAKTNYRHIDAIDEVLQAVFAFGRESGSQGHTIQKNTCLLIDYVELHRNVYDT